MNRRRFLIAASGLSASLARSSEPHAVPPELSERIGDLAAALADGNASEFLHQFDKRMAGYQDFGDKVGALTELAELSSSVKPFSEEVVGARHVIQAEWSLEITIRDEPPGARGASPAGSRSQRPGSTEVRARTVTMTLEKQGRKWRFIDFQPRSLFDPPAPAAH